MEFKITSSKVYGLDNAITASGYPMKTDLPISNLDTFFLFDNDVFRAKKLGNAKPGSGHDSYLKGIIVQYDLTAPLYFWKQFQRYHFHDIISSQSTMHKILEMDIDKQCNDWVFPAVKLYLKSEIESYKQNKKEFEKMFPNDNHDEKLRNIFKRIVSNVPSGFCLTARVTSNYLQLKTIYNQRKHHKLDEWHQYCEWCLELVCFKDFCVE